MRILVIGDSHIPERAIEIPALIYGILNKLTETAKFDYIFFTGDLIEAPKIVQFLQEKTFHDIFFVLGNMDFYCGIKNLPEFQELVLSMKERDTIKIGLTHGAQIHPRGDHAQIELLAKEKGYNIIITGHTHKEEVYLFSSGILSLNPGSVTGAWSFLASRNSSFILMEIELKKSNIHISHFILNKKEQKISERSHDYNYLNKNIVEVV